MLSAEGDDDGLIAEVKRARPLTARVERPGLVAIDAEPPDDFLPVFALARQTFPAAERRAAASVNAWARAIAERVAELPEGEPWRLHVVPHYGTQPTAPPGARALHTSRLRGAAKAVEPSIAAGHVTRGAGQNRCRLIATAVRDLLKERRRAAQRALADATTPFTPAESLIQVLLTSPETGWVSVARAPGPHAWRRLISAFPAGEVPLAIDKEAPSRAFAKLVEAEQLLGRAIGAGETCVDLGASPGGWTWVAVQRGAHVIAVDRSPLRDDLMRHPRVSFAKGDAFTYQPREPVDWLLCDVIAAPERAIQVVLDWLHRGSMRWFIVTIKLKGPADHAKLDRLKRELPALTDEWFVTHLCANKGEACVFGRRS